MESGEWRVNRLIGSVREGPAAGAADDGSTGVDSWADMAVRVYTQWNKV